MKCRYARRHLVELFDAGCGQRGQSQLAAHVMACPQCRREYEEAKLTLAALRPSRKLGASPGFKERVIMEIKQLNATVHSPAVDVRPWPRLWKPALAGGIVALLVIAMSLFNWMAQKNGTSNGRGPLAGFSLLAEAWAAEDTLLLGASDGKVVHIVNEIVVKATSNAALAGLRWFPLCSLDAGGSIRFNQLRLAAEPGEGYIVMDEAWYEPHTGRFARVLAVADRPLFANSYDGAAIYSLEGVPAGAPRVAREPVTGGFKPPQRPAEFLGVSAGFRSGIDETDKALVSDAGEGELRDGTPVRILKVGMPGPDGTVSSYVLFKIRKDDRTIAEMEHTIAGESLLVVRRVSAETVRAPAVPWDLAGIESRAAESRGAAGVTVRPDMVLPDVSVEQMVKKADLETYLFAGNPPWATQREITDILDLVSPGHRMFAVSYRAEDGRHVVLVQAHSFNNMIGPLARSGRLVYSSPNGFKVWSGPRDKWLAGILLNSARAAIRDPAADDRTGYVLESPAGAFPCLAVNGRITDDELHALVDSLVAAKQYVGE